MKLKVEYAKINFTCDNIIAYHYVEKDIQYIGSTEVYDLQLISVEENCLVLLIR